MSRFLCFFAAILVVANGYAIGGGGDVLFGSGGGGGGSGSGGGGGGGGGGGLDILYGSGGGGGGSGGGGGVVVDGQGALVGRVFQLKPAVSVQTISALSGGSAVLGGNGGSSGGGGSSVHCGGSSIDIRSLLSAIGDEISAQQAANIAQSLPSAGRPLIDNTVLIGSSDKSGDVSDPAIRLSYFINSRGGSASASRALASTAYSGPSLPSASSAGSSVLWSSAPAVVQIPSAAAVQGSSASAAASLISDSSSDIAAPAAAY